MAPKARSVAHPLLALPEVEAICKLLLGKVGPPGIGRDGLARLLGYKDGQGGLAARKISALVQFGFLSRSRGNFTLSHLADEILRPTKPGERRAGLLTAFESPPLYRKILRRFRRQEHLPEHLANLLTREYGITLKAGPRVAESFLVSGRYAGALTREGGIRNLDPSGRKKLHPEARPLAPSVGSDWGLDQRFELSLPSGGRAVLLLPSKLQPADFARIRGQLKFLESCSQGGEGGG